ncbi:MAG: glutamate 5-kinase [Gammaproteobacteria bacterium]|nr:glutamate 5-kinase [Gammaproteobacteria bacterium]
MRESLSNTQRWVVKVGSALLTDDGRGLDQQLINQLAAQIAQLRAMGMQVLVVSSGSVAAGMTQLGMQRRPDRISDLQAAAAVGQASLIRHYETAFKPHGTAIAQVLLTHADLANRERYLNARNTLLRLLELGVQCVINENDTVATEEICVGDNDSLAALACNLVDADVLVILTDQDGLYSADPRLDESAQLLHEVEAGDPALEALAGGSSKLGRGGMVTKLSAAKIANGSGASTLIANGRSPDILSKLQKGEQLGTLFKATKRRASKKQWMAGQMRATGSVKLDGGAVEVLANAGKSLLAVGVTAVNGDFKRGELIQCLDENGVEIARGLSNYAAAEVQKIRGRNSSEIAEILGYAAEAELIHRDNLVLID